MLLIEPRQFGDRFSHSCLDEEALLATYYAARASQADPLCFGCLVTQVGRSFGLARYLGKYGQ